MSAGILRGDRLLDASVRADHVSDAPWVGVAGGVTGAVGETHAPVDVAQEREGESLLLGEAPVGLGRVEGDAQDLDAERLEIADSVTEPAALARSTGR